MDGSNVLALGDARVTRSDSYFPDKIKRVPEAMISRSPPSPDWNHRVIAVIYGLTCHALFAIGVGTMIGAMFHGMSLSLGWLSQPWSSIANATLLVQFPLLHSFLLGNRGRKVLDKLAPRQISGRMSTTTYVIVASLQVFLLFGFWTPSGIIWWRAEGAIRWAICCVYAGTWLILLKAIWDAGLALQAGFIGWWAVFWDRAPVFPPMPTDGLFRFVRQPIYVAFALTVWTVPTWTPDQLVVAHVLTSYCLIGPLMKEERFKQRFGDRFAAYSCEVPYWLPRRRSRGPRND
jgi:methanethiol S-methyltransferase